MKHWSLKIKLLGSFLAVAVITLVVGIVGWRGTTKMDRLTTSIAEDITPSSIALQKVQIGLEQFKTGQRALINPKLPPELREMEFKNIAAARQLYGEALKEFEALATHEEDKKELGELRSVLGDWRKVNDEGFSTFEAINQSGIPNPALLIANTQQFSRDHYKTMHSVGAALLFGTPIEGTDDPTACAFGKWAASFQIDNKAIQANFEKSTESHKAYHAAVKEVRQLLETGQTDAAKLAFQQKMIPAASGVFEHFTMMVKEATTADELYNHYEDLVAHQSLSREAATMTKLREMIDARLTEGKEFQAEAGRTGRRMIAMNLIGGALGFILALSLGLILAITITRSIQRVITGLSQGSEQVFAASGQVAQSSQQMAEGASEQASSLEEVSASLEELTSMTRQNADNAQQSNAMASESRTAAERGNESVKRMAAVIQSIKNSSDETAKIVKTIDEIAFQTNLLALNAAVEAARAGEAGKGFAVVAEEVRNLARRSAEAAKNTAELIEGAQKNADNGVAASGDVAAILHEIVESVGKVAQLIAEVSAASNEQSKGIEQINSAINQMDKVTQSNAASAEESASASEQLSAQSRELKEMVNLLVGIVGGNRADSDPMLPPPVSADWRAPAMRRSAPAPRETASRQPRRAAAQADAGHSRGNGANPAAAVAAGRSKSANPEEVIPLDEEDFKDF